VYPQLANRSEQIAHVALEVIESVTADTRVAVE
jgi:hypothetical protein